MPIDKIHSFLVNPSKHDEDQPKISGTAIPHVGRFFNMLSELYGRADHECNIDIVFQHAEDGSKQNDCRDLIAAHLDGPTIHTGRALAKRLQAITTRRSGLGLLFIMTGTFGNSRQIVISRFPADQGIVAREHEDRLDVEFIERVFMKNANAYKCVLYRSATAVATFWDGKAIDRQITDARDLSDYWIRDFLLSELKTTGAHGTRRLAEALRAAVRAVPDLDTRQELISAAKLLRGQDGKNRSAREFVEQLGLSPEAVGALERELPRADMMDEVFRFNRQEFEKHVPFRAIQLDNGGLMIAEESKFEDVFKRQDAAGGNGRARFTTEGRVVDETLRKQR